MTPHHVYKNDGWISWPYFLGTREGDFISCKDASDFVIGIGIKTVKEWQNFCKSGNRPKNIPSSPPEYYKNRGWTTWSDWFGKTPFAWTDFNCLNFLIKIENEINYLDTIELLIIIEKFGPLKKLNKNKAFEIILKSSPNSILRKLNTQVLLKNYGSLSADKKIISILDEAKKELGIDNEINIDVKDIIVKLNNNEEKIKLPKISFINSLKSFDNEYIVSYLDGENLDFLVKYRVQKIWNEVINGTFNILDLEKETGGKYFNQIKDLFLNEYQDALDLEIPEGYCFEDENGNYIEPNLMQKLTAFKVSTEKRYGNWSEAGSGKTLSAVLSSRYIGAKNNLIVTFNSTTEYWAQTILNAFPDSVVNIKRKNEICFIEGEFNYLILNYESFQQPDSEEFVDNIIDNVKFDFIVLDEVQNIKQRQKFVHSKRKGLVHKLLLKSAEKNPDMSMLFMSCTPIINNLMEPVTILEMLNGVSYEELDTKPNVNNALEIYKHFVLNGIRFKSDRDEIEIKETIIKIDGSHLVEKLRWLSNAAILDVEQTLMSDKLLRIADLIEPGTLIYTYYVQDIIEPIKSFVEHKGMSVGCYTGADKDGLDGFLKGNVDVLIGSEPIATGVDGIQKICNKLIILTMPWTSAEYENLVGRIKRQGSNFEKIEIIIPQVEINLGQEKWSWDNDRLDRIKFKRGLSDTALDGIVPDEKLPTRSELVRNSLNSIREWIDRVENNEQRTIERKKLVYQ